MISQAIFISLLSLAIFLFSRAVGKISRNIKLGKPFDRTDHPKERWKTMLLVAIGQSKMVKRPLAGIMHILIYAGFIIINIEVLEILLDGITGKHRIFSFMGSFYSFLITSFEFLAVGVIVACVTFLIRRNIGRIKRFWSREMTIGPRSDANFILIAEIALMCAFLLLDTSDTLIQRAANPQYEGFAISNFISTFFTSTGLSSLHFIERFCWWFHITGILIFLNYVPYSKHFHIFLSFPNVYYSKLEPKGEFNNLDSITKEIQLMLNPSQVPADNAPAPPGRFGAKDVFDLSRKQLMDAYSCTECGRCTSSCPANITGKLLSPRKIMMDTRDRLEEVGRNIDKNGEFKEDGKSLLGDYILPEEVWACTSCNACTEECPVNIDPLSIITDIRRYLVMEQSAAPKEIALMLTNVENNGAPWQFPASERLNWHKICN
jgi:heterodisulfide reductase subunit C